MVAPVTSELFVGEVVQASAFILIVAINKDSTRHYFMRSIKGLAPWILVSTLCRCLFESCVLVHNVSHVLALITAQ